MSFDLVIDVDGIVCVREGCIYRDIQKYLFIYIHTYNSMHTYIYIYIYMYVQNLNR